MSFHYIWALCIRAQCHTDVWDDTGKMTVNWGYLTSWLTLFPICTAISLECNFIKHSHTERKCWKYCWWNSVFNKQIYNKCGNAINIALSPALMTLVLHDNLPFCLSAMGKMCFFLPAKEKSAFMKTCTTQVAFCRCWNHLMLYYFIITNVTGPVWKWVWKLGCLAFVKMSSHLNSAWTAC